MRLIDADELKEAMLEESDWWENADVWIAHNVIDKAPTVVPAKRGKWINSYGDTPYDPRDKNNWWHCSECKHPVTTMFKSPWCPECGAKMVGD